MGATQNNPSFLSAYAIAAMIAVAALILSPAAHAQSGYQTINGTQVYTVVNQPAGIATFSNSCGSQTLTQSQLQQGAIPSNIIPCPRSGGSAGSYVPSVPNGGGANNLANGLNLFGAALGVAKAIQDATPSGSSEAAYAPPPTTGSIDNSAQPSAPTSRRGITLYDKAAAQNRQKQPCAAEKLFANAAAAFRSAGDERRGNDAALQASMAGADCADALKRESEKYVYYCVDEENVYGRAWIPTRPGEGCSGDLKERKAPKGVKESDLRKRLRERLAKQLADDAATRASGAASGESEQLPWAEKAAPGENALNETAPIQEAEATGSPSDDDDPLKHYLAQKKDGYSNGGQFDPPAPGDEGLMPADNAFRNPEPTR
ncbi:MAG: hypothetical protein ACKVP4_11770 [Hyphomicrobium sp.]